MGGCWHELPSLERVEKMLLCPVCSLPLCLMAKEAHAVSSPVSPGNVEFGNFLLGLMAGILCGPEGTFLDRVSGSALPARCNIAHEAVAQGRAERV